MRSAGAGRAAAAVAVLVLAAACSGGSSAGSPPTDVSPSATSTSSGADTLIDKATVDASLTDVLSGLTTLTSVPPGGGAAATEAGLRAAASKLTAAGQALNPSPEGVPDPVASPAATGLLNVATLMTKAATCIAAQEQAAHPVIANCAQPLRQADDATGSLARDLISLAAYGSESPKTFESQLVAALGGK